MKEFRWKQQLYVGQQGEELIRALFSSVFGLSLELADMEDQRRGVDYVVPGFEVEVKTETYPPVNLFIEYETEDGRPSGHAKSEADVFVHVFPQAGVAYLLNGAELRQFIQEHIGEYEAHRIVTRNGRKWAVVGAAVPLKDIETQVSVVKVTLRKP